MNIKNKKHIIIIAGLAIILLTPYVPDFLMTIINSDYSPYDYRYVNMRLALVMSSIRLFGIFLTLWGFILEWKEK